MLVTVAPVVGKPVDAAGIVMPLSCAHVMADWMGRGADWFPLSPPHPAMIRLAITAVTDGTVQSFLACMHFHVLLFWIYLWPWQIALSSICVVMANLNIIKSSIEEMLRIRNRQERSRYDGSG